MAIGATAMANTARPWLFALLLWPTPQGQWHALIGSTAMANTAGPVARSDWLYCYGQHRSACCTQMRHFPNSSALATQLPFGATLATLTMSLWPATSLLLLGSLRLRTTTCAAKVTVWIQPSPACFVLL